MSNFDLLGGLETEDVQALAREVKTHEQPKAAEAPKADTRGAGRGGAAPKSGVAARMHGEAAGAPAAGRGGRGGRGRGGRGEGRGRGGFGDRPPRTQGERTSGEGEEGAVARFDGRGERRGGGRVGGRGGRGRGGFNNPNKRDYDRRDGTGRGHEGEKRGGAGKANWGTTEDGVPAENAAEVEAEQETGEQQPAEVAGKQEPEMEPEPEEKTMTLEEYEQLQEERRAGLNKETRVAEVDLEQFKGMTVNKKKDVLEEDPLEMAATKELGKKKQGVEKERKEKNLVADVGFRIQDDGFRPRGGGRGAGRGGRGRGSSRPRENRPYRDHPAAGGRGNDNFSMADTAFPALA